MSISYIDSSGGTTAPTTTTTTKEEDDNSSFTQFDFITLLVEELTNQDPTTPTSTSEMMNQLTQMQSITASAEQTDALDNLVTSMSKSMEGLTESMEGMVESFDTMVESMDSMVDDVNDMMADMNDMITKGTSAISEMSALMDVNNNLIYAMVYDNTFQNACGLTGSYVTGTDSEGNSIEGTVKAAFIEDKTIYLSLDDGSAMPYANLTGVAEEAPATSGDATNTEV